MRKLHIDFEHCYGIKKLTHVFDFDANYVQSIYAPNGFMKSSFAKVFIDLSKGVVPKDEIFTERTTVCNVNDENCLELIPENIFVIESYNESYSSKKISTLLVNQELKEEYENIYTILEEKKDQLIKYLSVSSHVSKNSTEKEFLATMNSHGSTFFEVLIAIESLILDEQPSLFLGINYSIIFDEKVKKFLDTAGVKPKLLEYINKYNDLLEKSQYYKKGIFNHNNAITISKTLDDNGFFRAEHTLNLKKTEGEAQTISTAENLSEIIEAEKTSILQNPELQVIFQKIDDLITKNIELKNFRTVIENNQSLISCLNNPEVFKQDLWISYSKEHKVFIHELIELYKQSKTKLEEIIAEAKNQETVWHTVVQVFNSRFIVPFKLEVENKADVILNNVAPNVKFIYHDGAEYRNIDDQKLKKVLSTGEKRALYILNIIFEIEARKATGNKSILIIDDIADSFDYKNKYAIVEYLKEILETEQFYMIILTHNFDFYRTIHGRLNILRKHCYMTMKNDQKVELIPAGYLSNVFNYWKTKIDRSNTILISSIPFVRNLTEYVLNEHSSEYLTLTALLHIKANTTTITLQDLASIFNCILNQTYTFGNQNKVLDLIFSEAENIILKTENNELENKVALSIAIRLKAEIFMIHKIANTSFVNSIESNQTFELFNKYKELHPTHIENLNTLELVNLMTPENIHLNSFMYEPILDMSDRHLIKLYADVKNLQE